MYLYLQHKQKRGNFEAGRFEAKVTCQQEIFFSPLLIVPLLVLVTRGVIAMALACHGVGLESRTRSRTRPCVLRRNCTGHMHIGQLMGVLDMGLSSGASPSGNIRTLILIGLKNVV